MEYKKMVLYFGLTASVIGVRQHHFDWQEGDVITTNGEKTEIYAIFPGTPYNIKYIRSMFYCLNTESAFRGMSDDELVCNDWTVKKRQWSTYDKRLDFMEEIVEDYIKFDEDYIKEEEEYYD